MRSLALISRENDCRSCYKCIRNCPTKSISFHDGQASIIPNECVYCGRCYEVCPQNCKQIRDDKEEARALIAKGNCVASLAPSFLSSYPGTSFDTMKDALLRLGFMAVEETAIGATIVKKEYDRLVNSNTQDVIISTCCHSVNLLVEKHYPKAEPYLAHILSPMQAHAQDIKARYPGASVIFLGPCISKKNELDRYEGYEDCVLTYLELDELLAEKSIEVAKETDPKKLEESLARLFPIEGGILATMVKDNPDYEYIAVSGMENCLQTLKDIIDGKVHHAFIEMSACAGSCINGPAIRPEARSFASAIIDIRRHAGKKDFRVKDYASKILAKPFRNQAFAQDIPSEEEITNVLKKIGKTSRKDELNCSSCGYSTCREKAIAVIQGKATLEMCLPYLMEKERSFASSVVEESKNGLAVINETFQFTLVNPALSRMMGKSQNELLSSAVFEYFDLGIFGEALEGKNVPPRRLAMIDSDKIFEVSLTYQSRYNVLIAAFRDVTIEERNKRIKAEKAEKTAAITSEVIAKNMRAVQEIAQLLGEATAETKIALTNLQKTLQEDDGDE